MNDSEQITLLGMPLAEFAIVSVLGLLAIGVVTLVIISHTK